MALFISMMGKNGKAHQCCETDELVVAVGHVEEAEKKENGEEEFNYNIGHGWFTLF